MDSSLTELLGALDAWRHLLPCVDALLTTNGWAGTPDDADLDSSTSDMGDAGPQEDPARSEERKAMEQSGPSYVESSARMPAMEPRSDDDFRLGARVRVGRMRGPGPPMPIEHAESSGREFLFYGE